MDMRQTLKDKSGVSWVARLCQQHAHPLGLPGWEDRSWLRLFLFLFLFLFLLSFLPLFLFTQLPCFAICSSRPLLLFILPIKGEAGKITLSVGLAGQSFNRTSQQPQQQSEPPQPPHQQTARVRSRCCSRYRRPPPTTHC